MNTYLESLQLELAHASAAGQARKYALEATPWSPTPTTSVAYTAANRLLLIGERETIEALESEAPAPLLCYLAVAAERSADMPSANGFYCAGLAVSGYLGRFRVMVDGGGGEDAATSLASIFNIESGLFDQILDCGPAPLLRAAILPPGYHYAGDRETARKLLKEQIPELIGEFEKPRYFHYDAAICAHARSGIAGCRRCLDACPTEAIISIGETIEVNPHLCQGGGTCASVCPTGAVTYRYPNSAEQIDFLRVLFRTVRADGGNFGLTLLLFDREYGHREVAARAAEFHDRVIPMIVEEIGSVGLELVVSALAFGANRICIFTPQEVPEMVRAVLDNNRNWMQSVLDQLQLTHYAVTVTADLDGLCTPTDDFTIAEVATYAAAGDKRNLLRGALEWLWQQAGQTPEAIELPPDSLFGRIEVDAAGCTLCMGCVSVCPAGALQAGGDTPALRFIEANCVQCGICTQACPETVISLRPRLLFDPVASRNAQILNQEEPFRCIRCGKAFATQSMIGRMTAKLEGHWMFAKPEAMNRLKMCEDCRVKDLFDEEKAGL